MERLTPQDELVETIEAHRETGKVMREAAANVGVALERERIRKAVELIVPVGVEPEDWMISRQAVLDLLSEPTNSKN